MMLAMKNFKFNYPIYFKLFVSLISILFQSNLFAQATSNCSNIGFEGMNTSANQVLVPGWQLWIGRNTVPGQYTIENAETHASYNCSTGIDNHAPGTHCGIGGTGVKVYQSDYQHHDIKGNTSANIGDLIAAPALPNLSGTNSRCIRLGGEQQIGMEASGMSTSYTVNAATPFLAYHYLLRFENTGHTVDNRGFAYLRIRDDQGNIIDCGSFETYENGPGETWQYDNTWDTWYMPQWKTWIVDLTNFAGQTMDIEVWVADCQEGAHGSWGYFDFECLTTATPDCSTVPCADPTLLNLTNNSATTCESSPITINGTSFGGSASQANITHDGNGSLSISSSTVSPFNVTYTPDASDAGNTVTVFFETNNPLGLPCQPQLQTFEITVNEEVQPTFPNFGPYCQGDPPPNLPTTSNEGVTGTWNSNASTATTGTTTYTFTPDASQCAVGTSIDIVVNGCAPLTVCMEANGDITVSGGDGPYSWDEETTINTTTPINNEQDCIDCIDATPSYFFGFYNGCSQNNCASTGIGWVNFATGITVTPTGNYPIQITDNAGQVLVINSAGDVASCSGCTPPPVTIAALAAVCEPATVDLATSVSNTGTGIVTYHGSQTDADAGINAISSVVSNTGTYYVRVEDAADPACSTVESIDAVVNPQVIPAFAAIGPLCSGDALAPLSTTSNNGITGSWSPGINNLATTTYTFTPDAGQCADPINMTILVNPRYTSSENVSICINSNYTYPDGFSETISSNTSHTSILTSVDGCDSTIVTNITAESIATNNIAEDICFGSNYTYADGLVSANITTNESHTSTFTGSNGCDSLVVEDLNVVSSITNTIDIDVCEGNTYVFANGSSQVISTSTSVSTTLSAVNGCDSIVTENVTSISIFNGAENVNACQGELITFPDGSTSIITGNTSHTSNLTTAAGCDSIIVSNVVMNPVFNITDNLTVCSGSNYTYPDGTVSNNIVAAESHISSLSSASGCDSIITTNISISTQFTSSNDFNICSGTNYTYADGTISNNVTVDETYTSNFVSASGCDSLVTENLIVLPIYNLTENILICEGETINYPDGTSEVVANSTVHVSNLITGLGCDSIITTNVTMNAVSISMENVFNCEGAVYIYPDGFTETITAASSHTSTLTSAAGCDSTIVTNVTMNPNYNLNENITVCENDTYTFPDGTSLVISNNTTYTSNLLSQDGCDSIIFTNVSVNPSYSTAENITVCEGETVIYPDGTSIVATVDGAYISNLTTAHGCDSIITTNLTVSPVPSISLAFTDPTSCGSSDGTITIGGLIATTQYIVSYNGNTSSTLTTDANGEIVFGNLPSGTFTDFYVENLSGCAVLDNSVINISALVAPQIDQVSVISLDCFGDDDGEIHVSITGGTGVIAYGITNNAGINQTNATGDFIDLPSGSYSVIVTDQVGCQSTDLAIIDEPAEIIPSPVATDILCHGDANGAIEFINTNGGTPIYQYSIDAGINYQNSTVFSGLTPGSYQTIVMDQNGCVSAINLSNIQEPNELVFTNSDVLLVNPSCISGTPSCNGEIMINSPSGGTPSYTYNWPNGISNPTSNSANNLCAGPYTLGVTDQNGCIVDIQVELTDPVIPVINSVSTTSAGCQGDCNGLIDISADSTTSYSIGMGTTSNPIFTDLCSGTYTVSVSNADGCEAETTVIIESALDPNAAYIFNPPYGTAADPSINFNNLSENATSYFWTIQNIPPTEPYYATSTDLDFIHIFPELPGVYEICLQASNDEGCIDEYCNGITIRDDYTIYVPNAFTPDNDAYNQTFKPILNGIDEQNYELLIFNRWGELIFESHNKEVGWDGTYQNKMVQDGVYIWQIEFKLKYTDERITKRGHVSILR
jgi:gliding motility-associated-like protein